MASITPERRARLDREKANNTGRGNFYSMKGKEHDVIRMTPLGPNDDVGVKYVYYFLNKKSYVCNFETHKVPGVISTAKRALQRIKTEEAQEMAKVIDDARRGKHLMKIIARSDAVPRVQVFEAPKAIYMAAFNALDKDGEDVSHNKEGRDIRWSKQDGTSGKGTKYDVRLLDKSPLHEEKETRLRLKDEAAKIDLNDLTQPNETGAVEALREIIPKPLWAQIKEEVLTVLGKPDGDGDDDADGNEDADEAPKAGKPKPAPAASDDADEDDVPAKPAARPAAAKPAAKAADPDEDDAPPAKPAQKAQAAKAADPDDDDDVPAKPARQAAKPVTVDDDDEAPTPAANKKRYEVADEDEPPKPSRRAAVVNDDDDD